MRDFYALIKNLTKYLKNSVDKYQLIYNAFMQNFGGMP